ncbi:hypothetical protein [Gimesia fumaroli]|jgi:hypothetical protein|uniref:Uncharacterized protein n=1 Tax=Gimesia fumaroli TaxID=2527976 RepID=A0A518IEZ2_9PLAN|nr:hypothetical protein [Gimesia fumaroli]QDV51654.1 hypothetical protein Enr17x_37110 [Gimesia fumaroli]
MTKRIQLLSVLGVVLLIGGISIDPVSGTPKNSLITTLSLKPNVPEVNLFDGIKQKTLSARVFPKSAYSSSVFITNQTKEPLTVKIPPAVSSVHILAQVDPGNGLLQGLQGNQQPQTGDSQAVGGNLSPVGNNQNFDFQGLFTIPPEKTVRLQLRSVCLEHGKPCPSSLKTYELRPIDTKVKDKALVLLLKKFNPRRDDLEMMQAIAWHLGSHMDWQELANKKKNRHIGGGVPYFSRAQLTTARKVVELARIESNRTPAEKEGQLYSNTKSELGTTSTVSRVEGNRR